MLRAAAGRASEPFDVRHRTAEFGICLAEFQDCFVPIFLHYAPILPFWDDNVCLGHCMLEVYK